MQLALVEVVVCVRQHIELQVRVLVKLKKNTYIYYTFQHM